MENPGTLKLYMLLLGCRPKSRLTEQHDVFFGIGRSLKELVPSINASWPEGKANLHIDAWREVNAVGNFRVTVSERSEVPYNSPRLFFLNLGGYRPEEFDELHYKLLVAAETSGDAIREAKATAFFRHTGFKGAASHIDDKYGVDVDEVYEIAEILPETFKQAYAIVLEKLETPLEPDAIHLGYQPLWKIKV